MTDEPETPEKDQSSSGSTAVGAADSTDYDANDLALDDPEKDIVDRSVVVSTFLKKLAWWALRLFVIAAGGYVVWLLIQQFWAGLQPMILALIICTVLAPPTTWLRRIGFPDALAALVSILLFFGILGGIIALIAPDLVRQSQVLYLQAFAGVQRLILWAQGPPLELNTEGIENVLNDIASWLQDQATSIAGGVVSGISTATSWIIQLFMILVLVVFFLKDGHKFLPWARQMFGRRMGWHATEMLTRSWTTLGGYIRAQAIVSAVDAFFIGLGLWLIGVPMAFTLAIITFVAGFIPYIGPIVAGALSVLVALVSLGFEEAILALLLAVAVQQLEGNILNPVLQSKAMKLHPVIVLISVVIGGSMLGILGAFLAVPVAAVIAVGLRYLIDMITLQAGEKTIDDMEFVTPEGRAVGQLNQQQGRTLREEWRKEGHSSAEFAQLVEEDQKKEEADSEDEKASDNKAAKKFFEQAIGKFRKR